MEHVLQIRFGVHPRSDGVAEEDEVLDDSSRVHGDHGADSSEGRVLLLVVADVPQRSAPDL